MKKWIMTSLLGGMLLSGTWAGAQPKNDSPASAPVAQAGAVEANGGIVTASVKDGGAIVNADGTVTAFELPATPATGVVAGGGTVVGSGAVAGPGRVVTFRRVGAGPLPAPASAAVQVQGRGGDGRLWITAARTSAAGKTEKAPFLGVVTTRASATLRSQLKLKAGLVVDRVEPKSSAETAGLQVHDIIEKCDDQWLINPAQFIGVIRMYKPGETVTLTVLRQGERKKITAKLEERETYAMADEDGNIFFARQNDAGNPAGPLWVSGAAAGAGGPLQQISAGAMSAAPLVPGFFAAFGDDKQQLLITIRDGHQILTAKDPNGKEIFQGPIDTPEERKSVPQDVRRKLEEMEKIRVKIRTPNFEGAESAPETAPKAP